MTGFNFVDFYLGYPGHPRFRSSEMIEDEVLGVIVQKWEMILFTNKGEVFGDPEFGANLHYYLHETRLSSDSIRDSLIEQIDLYIPELKDIDYDLTISIFDDPERHQECMEIYFKVSEFDVFLIIS
jgi:hypothetical protein